MARDPKPVPLDLNEGERHALEAMVRRHKTGGKRRIDHAAITTMTAEGASPTLIAQQVGCSRMQVYRVLSEG